MAMTIKKYDGKKATTVQFDKSKVPVFSPTGVIGTVSRVNNFNVDNPKVICSRMSVLFQGLVEVKAKLKERVDIKINIATETNPTYLFVVNGVTDNGGEKDIISFPKYSAIVSYQLWAVVQKTRYDWTTGKYEPITIKETFDPLPVNRLAESIGLNNTSKLYFLYVQGVEFIFERAPEEVMAICLWKASNAKRLKLTGDIKENMKNLIAKLVKQASVTYQDTSIVGVKKVLASLNQTNIDRYYAELDKTEANTGLSPSYEEIFKFLCTSYKQINNKIEA
nr:MAG: nucleocapsid [Artemisia fimovirus 1]